MERSAELEFMAQEVRKLRRDCAATIRAARAVLRQPAHGKAARKAKTRARIQLKWARRHAAKHPNPDRRSTCQRRSEELFRDWQDVERWHLDRTLARNLQRQAERMAELAATAPIR